jgi:hypothetical protein
MPEPEESKTKRGANFLLAGKIAAGAVLAVLLVLVYTGFQDKGPAPGFMDVPPEEGGVVSPDPVSSFVESDLSLYEQVVAEGGHLAVRGQVDPMIAFAAPHEGAEQVAGLPLTDEIGETIAFLVLDEELDETGSTWYEVQLPIRPNGSTGWLRAGDTVPQPVWYGLRIDLSDFRLDVLEKDAVVKSYPIGLGRVETPTPLGDFYITVKMIPPDPDTVYGALAMGVSAFSEELTDWPGGGQVGIHGTNDPERSIGKNVSAGCIRLRNEDILELNDFAAVGTPVLIQE